MIAGREFSFLAYSSSALREHAVWAVTPFEHPVFGTVTAATIRAGLGDFDKTIRYPARLGARMSQAFSATDASITIPAEEIIEIPDIRNNEQVLFTDGSGSISRGTANAISAALESRHAGGRGQRSNFVHSAFQIRLGGSKGMLSVDYKMHDSTVRIRPSMNKFIADHSFNIEVAKTFEKPGPMYLNRPLIMILETLGVPIESFEIRQKEVIAHVHQSVRSTEASAQLLESYGLGAAFRLPSVLFKLSKLGLEQLPDNPFLKRGLDCVVNDILRSLKHKARIPIPGSWTLVGVPDIHKYLKEGEIFGEQMFI